jgi:hypothetical protein
MEKKWFVAMVRAEGVLSLVVHRKSKQGRFRALLARGKCGTVSVWL